MTPSHREFSDDHIPLAYFITFRSYGTWLHGDKRGSVDRLHRRFVLPCSQQIHSDKTMNVICLKIRQLS